MDATVPPLSVAEVGSLNQRLAEVSKLLYGDTMSLRVVAPETVRLLKKNARYMKKATFDQLAENVARDGKLASVPLCHTQPDGALECVSGNHRIKAALRAGLPWVLVLVYPNELDRQRMIAVQLSHNALAGQDDLHILAELWSELAEIQHKLYAGLDSDQIGELEKINYIAFNAEPVKTERIVLWFLPEEVERVDALLAATDELVGADAVYLCPSAAYQRLWEMLVKVKERFDIKNTAVAFMALVDRVEASGLLDEWLAPEPDGAVEE